MVIAEGDTSTRQIRLSREMVQIGIAAVLLLVAGFSSVATGLLVKGSAQHVDAKLVEKNQELRSELTSLARAVGVVSLSPRRPRAC